MPLGRPIGRSTGRGQSPTSRVGCCRDQRFQVLDWAAHCRRQPLLRILREKALQHWSRIRARRPQAMDQRPIGEKQVLGPGVRAARRQGHAEATLSIRPTQSAEPEACPLLPDPLGPGSEQTDDLLTSLLTWPLVNP
jgi:hypothetical protein